MDWTPDRTGLSERDLARVFKYASGRTTIIKITGKEMKLDEYTFTDMDWDRDLQKIVPSSSESNPGLVIIIAERIPERGGNSRNLKSCPNQLPNETYGMQPTIPPCVEKPSDTTTLENHITTCSSSTAAGGQRDVRRLPFSRDTFEKITKAFHTHPSISRVISRSDMPIFSASALKLNTTEISTDISAETSSHNSYVYNYKTTNAWGDDVALTATYFPQSGLTYAILFGCSEAMKSNVIRRLKGAIQEAAHPLLIPGMLAEIERIRHIGMVDDTTAELETRISQLGASPSTSGVPDPNAKMNNEKKREAWLNTDYLRNQLITWSKQLSKMVIHVDELRDNVFNSESKLPNADDEKYHNENAKSHMRWTGNKIKERLQDIIEEYEEKIRDCTMKLDGMAMATQWAQGETNVEIALATSRDSRHMRSIAILSMVFLPGATIASLFSTTLFQWDNPDSGIVVSHYIWIYFAITVPFTMLTVGLWYYFSLYRPSRNRKLV